MALPGREMRFQIDRDEATKVSKVEFTWTDGEVGDLRFGGAEQEILGRQVASSKEAAMVVLLISQAIEEQSERDKRQFN